MKVTVESIDDLLTEYDLETSKKESKGKLFGILDDAIKNKVPAPSVPNLEDIEDLGF